MEMSELQDDICKDCAYDQCSFRGGAGTCYVKVKLKELSICKNKRCNHVLIGKYLTCPNQNCPKYGKPTIE